MNKLLFITHILKCNITAVFHFMVVWIIVCVQKRGGGGAISLFKVRSLISVGKD
jgi:hypothetical protein